MARRKKGTKKVEKSKQKQVYQVVAPSTFNNKVVGEILASKPENLLMRIVPLSLTDLVEGRMDPTSLYTTVKLRVVGVGEGNVSTEFAGHETAFSYLRSLARRRRSVLHDVTDVVSKDGRKMRLKTTLITLRKVSAVVKTNLRHSLKKALLEQASKMPYNELVSSILLGSFSKDIAKELNKITPVTHFLVKKTEVAENLKGVVA